MPRRKRAPADDLSRFANNLRTARRIHGWNQTELAAASGIDRTIIVRIEQGARPPRFHQLLALHDALGVKRGSLLAA